jgi:hypothetical protein
MGDTAQRQSDELASLKSKEMRCSSHFVLSNGLNARRTKCLSPFLACGFKPADKPSEFLAMNS